MVSARPKAAGKKLGSRSNSRRSTPRTPSTPGRPRSGIESERRFELDAHFVAAMVDKNMNDKKLVEETWTVLRKQPVMSIKELSYLLRHAPVVEDEDDGKCVPLSSPLSSSFP